MKKLVSLFSVVGIIAVTTFIFPTTLSAEELTRELSVNIASKIGNNLSDFSFDIPEDGKYTLSLEYQALENKTTDMQISIKIDGNDVSDGETDISLPRFWKNENAYRVDGQGNQFAPEQVLNDKPVLYTLLDTSDYGVEPYITELKAGRHIFSVKSINNDSFYLSRVVFSAEKAYASYDEFVQTKDISEYDGSPIYTEGESATLKNSYWLTSASDGSSSSVTPSDPVKTKINYVGGANWSTIGDTVYWNVNVPEEGWYNISFSYKQNYVLNGKVYRWLRVNGETQFSEALAMEFPYNSDWESITFADEDGKPFKVYLKKGNNELSLTATLGDYTTACKLLDGIIDEIGNVYLDITMVTGETVDIYRDYRLFEQIPDFNERLQKISDKLTEVDDELLKLSGGEVGSYSISVRNMKQVLKMMIENPYTAHRYKTTYDSNYTALNSCLNEMQSTPLGIDRIILSSPNGSGLKSRNAFMSLGTKIGFSVRRFIASFTEDYNNISNTDSTDEKVTVWVNWGRDQAQILNMLIQSSFSANNNISVDVKISNASIVQGVISGNGPDVILQQTRTEPVNLAMRGVLYNLKDFEDCNEILNRFTNGAETPYLYKDGLYALPDTQTFFMMFYRTDILNQLGLTVPKTWNEFKEVVRVLSRNNLGAWLPYTQLTDMNIANTGVGSLNIFPTLLMQNGVSLYNSELNKTTLTEPAAIAVFNDWTSYYTKMKMSYQIDFYNRFRNGTCPIGIAPYVTYSTLKDAAKEIDGKWLMAAVPGVEDETGNINNTTAGGGTGCAILKSAKNPKAAWEFLKWWTSAETQLAYSNNLESVLGTIGRVAVSNKEAFAAMSWDSKMYDEIYSAWNNVTEIREIPGSYYISRSIDFAFWNVASMNKTPKDVLVTWGEEADAEITRKMVQYENR